MNTKNLRQEKGITLIALVITIIVMLILVSVVISLSLSGGLFEKARQAINDTKTQMEKEKNFGVDDIEEWVSNPNGGQGGQSGNTEVDGNDLTQYVGKTWLEWAYETQDDETILFPRNVAPLTLQKAIIYIAEENTNYPQEELECKFGWEINGTKITQTYALKNDQDNVPKFTDTIEERCNVLDR